MKYWNKNKKAREYWTEVRTVREVADTTHPWFAPAGLMRGRTFSFSPEAKLWCQQQPGKGRFYFRPYLDIWYFEFSEDALAFKLKWIGPN